MTLAELITSARDLTCDSVSQSYLWSDAEWTEYANDGEREACRRARLLIDSTTTEVCQITLDATHTTFDLDPRVIFIRRVKLAGQSIPLKRVSYKDLDQNRTGWDEETGTPLAYIPDLDTNLFRPFPSPIAAGTINMTVVRLPLADMGTGGEPEINSRYHSGLVHWMLHRAYAKQDSETLDKKKSAEYLDLFEQEFGKKSSALDETWIQREHGYTEDEGVF